VSDTIVKIVPNNTTVSNVISETVIKFPVSLPGAAGLTTEQVQDVVGAMVTGNTETRIAVTYDDPGALSSYWQNYAYDAYSQVREVDNLHFKEEIGLKHFVYQGGLIKTSRDFCIKKNGKAFKEADAVRDWPKDPDLIDKAHVATYRPIIDRGRYNCRHFLMWISEDYYNELTKGE